MANLPLVLAGPIVRRVEGRACSFWIALRDSMNVTAFVYLGEQLAGAGTPLASSTAATRAFGDHLHIALVTVQLPEGVIPGTLYSYDLALGSRTLQNEGLLTDKAPAGDDPGRLALGYVPNRLPSFVTPAAILPDLKIAHGSCRKTNGPGFDALAWLDDLIKLNLNNPLQRPQQLFLTGDQIYADDVGACLLPVINSLAVDIIGAPEKLPIDDSHSFESTLPNFPALRRQLLVRKKAGFSSTDAENHLLSFGEYAAMYCLAWNPAIWRTLATIKDLFIASKAETELQPLLTDWEACYGNLDKWKVAQTKYEEDQIERVKVYRDTTKKVARALANTITYMILDDHEITDDWNLTQRWRNRVYSTPLGRAIVRNGVMAYVAFQGWGNEPAAFATAGNNKDLLDRASEIATAHNAAPLPSVQRLEELIGISGADQSKQAKFHYTVPGARHLTIVMDSRTRRKYSGQNDFPPDLLGSSLDAQVPKGPLTDGRELLMLISPAPVLGTTLFDRIAQPLIQSIRDVSTSIKILSKKADDPCTPGGPVWGFEDYDAEGWAMNEEAQQRLLLRLAEYNRTVILSGDVHYGLSMEMDFWRKGVAKPSRIVQFTSSPLRNDFKPIIQALIRSNALLQDFERGLDAELLAWKTGPAPITLPANQRIGLGRRARMQRSPALLTSKGWPAGTSIPADKLPDWSWRLKLVRDARTNAQVPHELQQPPLVPAADLSAGNPLAGYRAVADRQAVVVALHFDHLRQLIFNTNFGFVTFVGSDATLKVTHTLMSHTAASNDNQGAPNTLHEMSLTTAADAQPPKIG
jgi:hypothetical protein